MMTTNVPDVWDNKFNSFKSMLAPVDYEHLKTCPCMRDRVLEEVRVQTEKEMATWESEGVESKSVKDQRLHNARIEAYKVVAAETIAEERRCSLERFVVVDILTHFDKDTGGLYDFSNSNVYLIMRSLVSQILSAHRMQLHSDRYGIVQEHADRDGNVFFELNPVELAKARIDKQIVDCVEKLNNIMYGTKSLNVNVNTDDKSMMSVHDLLVKIKAMDKEEPIDITPDEDES